MPLHAPSSGSLYPTLSVHHWIVIVSPFYPHNMDTYIYIYIQYILSLIYFIIIYKDIIKMFVYPFFPWILHDKDIQKPRGPRLVWKVPSMCQPVRLGFRRSWCSPPGHQKNPKKDHWWCWFPRKMLWSLTSENMVPSGNKKLWKDPPMLLMGKSTISTRPCSIANCLFTRG